MDSLTDALYTYAQEHRTVSRLQTGEYHRCVSGLEEEWGRFFGSLTAEQGRELEALLNRQSEAGNLEDRVSIGLELARL